MRRPRTVKYVISPKELSASWLILYAATFALQLPCAAIRAFLAYPPLWLAFKLIGEPTTIVHDLALLVGYGPLGLSLASLILPLGGWWWEQAEGGRIPSEREQLVYQDAIQQLRLSDPKLRAPHRWFVIDDELENAAAYADTVMISRGLLDSGYLPAVLAHELGHLNSGDARVSAALNRITTPPRGQVRRGLKTLCFLASGAAGVWPVRTAWSAYWRSREHKADEYAANLDQAETLGEFLDDRRATLDLPIPFIWLTEHGHPPTEHRVERLMRAATNHATNQARKVPGGRPSSSHARLAPDAKRANSGPLRTCQGNPCGATRRAGPDGLPLTEP